MSRRTTALLLLSCATAAGIAVAVVAADLFCRDMLRAQAAVAAATLALHTQREATTDLEIRGAGSAPAVDSRFAAWEALRALPQTAATVRRNEDFTEVPTEGIVAGGVDLDVLLRALGAEPGAAVEAVGSDGYTATYPAQYVREHHPILVLTVDGSTTLDWARKTHTEDLGPYFVAYADFVPAFRVLSHDDRAQVPTQVVRLELAPEERMFAGIVPRGAADEVVSQGYRIAQQNCFRCHDAAGYGGTKSGRSWPVLSNDARERPEWFAKWVHEPQSVDAKAEMPPNAKYDRATLTALTKYFAAMK